MLSTLKNKHLIASMIIAPILAVIAYLAVDLKVSEKPHKAAPGDVYKLAAQSNCRYQSGVCSLRNNDIKLDLRARREGEARVAFELSSDMPLQQALIAPYNGNTDVDPVAMQLVDDSGHWRTELRIDDAATSKLRLVVTLAEANYYAEVPALFVDYDTGFSQENFSH